MKRRSFVAVSTMVAFAGCSSFGGGDEESAEGDGAETNGDEAADDSTGADDGGDGEDDAESEETDDDDGADESISASLDATSENFDDFASMPFEANEGDEIDVVITAGSDGAEIGLVPEEGSVDGEDMMGGEEIGWSWSVDPDADVTDTVEIDADDSYVFFIDQGQAEIAATW